MRYWATSTDASGLFSSFFKEGYALRADRRAEKSHQLNTVWFDSLSIQVQPPTAAEVVQENYYSAFGNEMADLAYYKSDTLDYLFNAQPYERETGLYHYFARQYDPTVGRWNNVDPLADLYTNFSPYNFVLNNPLRYTDPDGMQVSGDGGTQPPTEGEEKIVNGIRFIYFNGQWTMALDDVTISGTPPFWKFYSAYTFYGYAYDFGNRGVGTDDLISYSYTNRGGETSRASNTPSLTATTMTAKYGSSKNYWDSKLLDKFNVTTYVGKIYGKKGTLFNKNIESFEGQFKGVEYSVNTATSTFTVSTVNYGVSVGTNILNAEIHVGVSLGDGITFGSSYTDSKNNIVGSDVSFRPGGYTIMGAAAAVIIWRVPQLLPLIAPYLAK